MRASAKLQPKQLYEQLENAVLFSLSDKPALNETLHLKLDPLNLTTAGRGRYAACIDSRGVEEGEGECEIILDTEEVKERIAEAKKVKGFGGKTARCDLVVDEEGMTLSLGDHHFPFHRSEIADEVESDEEHEGLYDHLFRMQEDLRAWEGPVRMTILRHMFKLADKIKHGETSRDTDPFSFLARQTGELGYVVMLQVGPVLAYQSVVEVD